MYSYPALDGPNSINLGSYTRQKVSNVDHNPIGRQYFDLGLRLMLAYQHELAAKCFLACLDRCPHCALAHGLLALCHSPNYNFKGEPYYLSACHHEDLSKHDLECAFPSQHVAERHSKAAMEIVEHTRKIHRIKKKGKKKNSKQRLEQPSQDSAIPDLISDVETQWLNAVRVLTECPGVDPDLSESTVGRPFADAMRKVYQKYPNDPEICYCFAESLMVLNAWNLYEYPSGKPVSPDVEEIRTVLERALEDFPNHPGLCHMYVHLSEMSSKPEQASQACQALRTQCPDAGHLLHMPTHIDVLIGNYEACVLSNQDAIRADGHFMKVSPSTAGKESFYFGYIVHNYHMAVFGCILGGFEKAAIDIASQLNDVLNEDLFSELPDLCAYLESYSALEVHVLIRFGRWKELLEIPFPKNKTLMLYRSATIHFGRALALAITGDIAEAIKEADRFDNLRHHPEAPYRILHNNSVDQLLACESAKLRGEILYYQGKYSEAFHILRKAVQLQDNLNYDEPWGIMQPIRHALGGLLCEQSHFDEAESIFREDLKLHPKNPWAMVGLLRCLEQGGKCCSHNKEILDLNHEINSLKSGALADYEITVPCECCQHP